MISPIQKQAAKLGLFILVSLFSIMQAAAQSGEKRFFEGDCSDAALCLGLL